jgi:hypothetical protein
MDPVRQLTLWPGVIVYFVQVSRLTPDDKIIERRRQEMRDDAIPMIGLGAQRYAGETQRLNFIFSLNRWYCYQPETRLSSDDLPIGHSAVIAAGLRAAALGAAGAGTA